MLFSSKPKLERTRFVDVFIDFVASKRKNASRLYPNCTRKQSHWAQCLWKPRKQGCHTSFPQLNGWLSVLQTATCLPWRYARLPHRKLHQMAWRVFSGIIAYCFTTMGNDCVTQLRAARMQTWLPCNARPRNDRGLGVQLVNHKSQRTTNAPIWLASNFFALEMEQFEVKLSVVQFAFFLGHYNAHKPE